MPNNTHSRLTVAVSGATGLIGSALVTRLRAHGHNVRCLTRSSRPRLPDDIPFDAARGLLDPAALSGCDAVVNLAGEPIAQRWTDARKREIRESRVRVTALIARTIGEMPTKPAVVLSGSAVGYYGDRGDELLDELSTHGNDFLSSVVEDWEGAAAPIANDGVRLVLLRTGLVLTPRGGALEKLLPPFRLGLGGPIGSGRQWMSWISLEDHLRAMEHALFTDDVRGPINLVTPNPVTNATFAATLGDVLRRPALVPVPSFAVKAIFGEMAEATILAGQRVRPGVLLETGFVFDEPMLEGALRSTLV